MTLPPTETVRAELGDLDCRTTGAILGAMLDQEVRAQAALRDAAPALAALIDAVFEKLASGGRLFYAGAGTSGRLAVLDAVECGPTFSLPPGIIVPIVAGGDSAIAGAVEGAEDDVAAPAAILASHDIGPNDALVGIAASGGTRFTRAAIEAAKSRGALAGCIVNSPGPIADEADIAVIVETGAEILAGSTRLSAGTTQKIALNALSTIVMIRLGKTFGPYMVDLKPTNAKLRARAIRIVAAIAHCDPQTAEAALRDAGFEAKTAIIMLRRGLDAQSARARLSDAKNRLRAALDPASPTQNATAPPRGF
ncbi:N-acetylmuramic acid 6-phosphate etherase [Acidiphilium sp. AL]|nr:N-acetylmuramic acid 6-phosphate etherase [Acidiphilium sp. AL]MCU4159528.1 N-acetylmuramic acid 6-phosphate etherase [Acidiphilium sp. AL]